MPYEASLSRRSEGSRDGECQGMALLAPVRVCQRSQVMGEGDEVDIAMPTNATVTRSRASKTMG